jgi:hypothetical protein
VLGVSALFGAIACGSGNGDSYNFSARASTMLTSTTLTVMNALSSSPVKTRALPNNCTDNVCFTPSALTGKYFGTGLMIQSGGSGMNAYFGQDEWSSITSASPTYDFDFETPTTQTGDLRCCVGSGDLASGSSYFSDAIYLFAYFDATFTVPAGGATGTAVGIHTVRFILADGAVTDTTFKWVDSTNGTLSTNRSSVTPVRMNTEVTNWVNPFGETKGNQTIPVIGTGIADAVAGGVNVVTEDELKTEGRTYTYDFPGEGFIFFPTVLNADIGVLSSRLELLKRIHVQGLPHSQYEMGSAGTTTLTITEPTAAARVK